MLIEIRCEGAPRDLGLDQGRACRGALRSRFAAMPVWERWLFRLGLSGSPEARLARDLSRYFPQQSEAVEGMVRGADLPHAWFAAQLVGEVEKTSAVGDGAALAADPTRTGGGAFLARALGCAPVVRHSRPDGGFASVECARPWLTAALAGVNEGGLAVTWAPWPGEPAPDSCTAPASLLVQDCLARFDSVGGAVDWCTGRPAGGRAVVLLCDATGELAAVEIDGRSRRVLEPEAGLALAGVDGVAAATLAEPAKIEIETAAAALGGWVAAVDPNGRRLAIANGADRLGEWFEVAGSD
jgi:hypothetical protein